MFYGIYRKIFIIRNWFIQLWRLRISMIDPPSASWRPRKAGGIIQRVWTFESQECHGQEKINTLAQITRQKKTEFFFCFFVLFWHWADWMFNHTEEGDSLYWVHWFSFHLETLSQGKKMFRQISRHPVIQSRWHIKLTITVCLEHIWRNEHQVWVLATAKGVSEARNSSPNINSV